MIVVLAVCFSQRKAEHSELRRFCIGVQLSRFRQATPEVALAIYIRQYRSWKRLSMLQSLEAVSSLFFAVGYCYSVRPTLRLLPTVGYQQQGVGHLQSI